MGLDTESPLEEPRGHADQGDSSDLTDVASSAVAQSTLEGLASLNLRQLACFFAVAETLHFGNAADKLYLSQPSVSEAVSRLERALGQPLLSRSTRRVQLTPYGVAFLKLTRPAYDSLLAAYQIAKRSTAGTEASVRLGHTPELGQAVLPELIRRLEVGGYGPLQPHRWTPAMMHTQAQLVAVSEGRLDVGFCWDPHAISGLDYRTLAKCPFVAVLREDDILAERKTLDLSDLADRDLLVSSRAYSRSSHAVLQRAMDAAGLMSAAITEVDEYEEIGGRVVSAGNIGIHHGTIALLPRMPGITFRLIQNPELWIAMLAVTHPGSSMRLRGFVDLLEEAAVETVCRLSDLLDNPTDAFAAELADAGKPGT